MTEDEDEGESVLLLYHDSEHSARALNVCVD